MNELRYKGLTVEDRVIVYFEMARDAGLISKYAEMLTAAQALIMLLVDAETDNAKMAKKLRREAARCGIQEQTILHAIEMLERG